MVTRPIYSPWEHKFPLAGGATVPDPFSTRESGLQDPAPRNPSLLEQQLRQQLARELHDGPVQTLSNVTMQLMVMQKQITADPGAVQKELSAVVASMQKAVKEMRSAMFELRPLALEREGLAAALREFVAHLRERYPIEVNLDVPQVTPVLAPVVQTNVYYIIQEAVQNTLKHARANHLRIALTRLGDELQVFVSDDGQGFDVNQVQGSYDQRKSLGLMNLAERAQLIGGQLTLYSNLGQGTTVHLSVPTYALS